MIAVYTLIGLVKIHHVRDCAEKGASRKKHRVVPSNYANKDDLNKGLGSQPIANKNN